MRTIEQFQAIGTLEQFQDNFHNKGSKLRIDKVVINACIFSGKSFENKSLELPELLLLVTNPFRNL